MRRNRIMRMCRALFFSGMVFFFSACEKRISEAEREVYLKQGQDIVEHTEKKLSGTLMEKLRSGGIPAAVSYCNTNALELTDSMASHHGVSIKRTALKVRNQLNRPNEEEREILQLYQDQLAYDQPLERIVEKNDDGSVNFYAPILAKQKCLMCHGTPGKELAPVTDSIIKSHYPNDLATGFGENELRGIWSIRFEKDPS